jgi:restriction system protein
MYPFAPARPVTPLQYELGVKSILDAAAPGLVSYESSHRHPVSGIDGEYIIDVLATFSALGAKFVVLVECKHEGRKTERHDIQVLHQKVQSTGAHKGMVFSVAGFQSGALEFAKVHGIATVHFAEGSTTWHTRGDGPSFSPPDSIELPTYVGWWIDGSKLSVLSPDEGKYTRQAIGLDET